MAKYRFLLGLLWVLSAGSIARAELQPGNHTLALFGGVGTSNSEYDYFPGDEQPVSGGGAAFGGQYLYTISAHPAWSLGVDLNSSLNGDRKNDDLLTGYDSTARLKSFVAMLVARLSFPRGTYRPYLFGGIGAHRSSQRLSARPETGNTWPGGGSEDRMLIDERETSFALGYGIGLDVFITENVFFGPEMRGTWLAGLNTDDTAALRAANIHVDDETDIGQVNFFFRAGLKF
jgi:opacity protein-like surface antigen